MCCRTKEVEKPTYPKANQREPTCNGGSRVEPGEAHTIRIPS